MSAEQDFTAVAYSAYFDLFQNSAEIDQELIERKYGNTNVFNL